MKELKFRVRDAETGKIYQPEEICSLQFDKGVCWAVKIWEDKLILKPELIEYTGRKDKNGVGIYEGDVIKPKTKRPWNYEVYWDDLSSSWRMRIRGEMQYDKTTTLAFAQSLEVIGNVFENPELVKL